jgi:hypothetical protein
VEGGETLAHTLDRMSLPTGRPVLVVVGGADGVGPGETASMDTLLREVVVPVLVSVGGAAMADVLPVWDPPGAPTFPRMPSTEVAGPAV